MQEPISRSTWAVSPSARVTDLQHVNSGGHRTVGDPQQKPGSIHCEKERKKERRKRWTHSSQMGASHPSLIASSRSGGCWKTKGKRSKRDQINQETERAAETGRNGQSGTKSRRRKCRRRKTKKNFSPKRKNQLGRNMISNVRCHVFNILIACPGHGSCVQHHVSNMDKNMEIWPP